MFKHDTLWKACFGEEVQYSEHNWEDTYEHYYRDQAFTGISCRRIQKWHRKDSINVCGEDWKIHIENLLNKSDQFYENFHPSKPKHYFLLRGDTAHVLACLVEENHLELLRRALIYAIRGAHRPEGHSVFSRDIEAAHANLFPDLPYVSASSGRFLNDSTLRNALVRRLAFRAGITKIDNHIYEDILFSVRVLSFQLEIGACLELVARPTPNEQPKMVLEQGHRACGISRRTPSL